MLAERESSFVATVQEGTPYRWTALDASLNLVGRLRLSQITYLPPTSLADLKHYDSSASCSPSDVYSVRAVVRTVTANNKVEDFVVACFPLEVRRLIGATLVTAPPPLARGGSPAAAAAAGPSPSPSIDDLLPQRTDAFASLSASFVLPCLSDVATRLNVHVGLDGFTELRVEGPGSVVFSGEEKLGMLGAGRSHYTLC